MTPERFKNKIELLVKYRTEKTELKIDMNKLMDEMMEDRDVTNNISRNYLLKILINKLDILNNKIKILESDIIYYDTN